MIDDMIQWSPPTVTTTPYSEQVYIDPKFGPWKEWFAWYPVKKILWDNEEYVRIYKWIWLQKINRRKVVDWDDGPGRESCAVRRKYYEYATLLDLLKYGY